MRSIIRNKRGEGLMLSVVIAIMLFIAGMIILNFIRADVTTAETQSNLDCGNLNISNGAKLTCLGTASVVPYFIVTIISVAGGVVFSKFLT